MTMQTYQSGSGAQGQIWGGVRTYTADQHAAVLHAVSRFTSENTDPKAAIIPTFNFVGAVSIINIPFILVTFFYDDAQVPSGVFDVFDAIPHLSDNTKPRTLESLSKEVLAGDMKGLRFRIAVNSFPAMPVANMTAFLTEHWALINKKARDAALYDLLDFHVFSFAVQPMPRLIAQASRDNSPHAGGNALGLDPKHGDKVWIEYDLAWLNPICDDVCTDWLKSAVQDAHDLHVQKYGGIYPTNYESGDLETLRYVQLANEGFGGRGDILKTQTDISFILAITPCL